MRRDEANHQAVKQLKSWLHTLTHADLSQVEDGQPLGVAVRLDRIFETLERALDSDRVFLTSTDRGLRSPVGPLMVLLDGDGALIAGVSRKERDERFPDPLRHRFTWP